VPQEEFSRLENTAPNNPVSEEVTSQMRQNEKKTGETSPTGVKKGPLTKKKSHRFH